MGKFALIAGVLLWGIHSKANPEVSIASLCSRLTTQPKPQFIEQQQRWAAFFSQLDRAPRRNFQSRPGNVLSALEDRFFIRIIFNGQIHFFSPGEMRFNQSLESKLEAAGLFSPRAQSAGWRFHDLLQKHLNLHRDWLDILNSATLELEYMRKHAKEFDLIHKKTPEHLGGQKILTGRLNGGEIEFKTHRDRLKFENLETVGPDDLPVPSVHLKKFMPSVAEEGGYAVELYYFMHDLVPRRAFEAAFLAPHGINSEEYTGKEIHWAHLLRVSANEVGVEVGAQKLEVLKTNHYREILAKGGVAALRSEVSRVLGMKSPGDDRSPFPMADFGF